MPDTDTTGFASYLFLPYLRLGMSSYLPEESRFAQAAGSGDAFPKRAEFQFCLKPTITKVDGSIVGATVEADGEGVDTPANHISKKVSLYGPGDLVGFDGSAIKGHDPKNDVGDFEPNYFPAVDFWDPDFPWRYTPFAADSDDQLKPWLVLVVLVAEDKGELKKEFELVPSAESADGLDSRQLPFIKNVSTNNLPDLTQSWRWAHVQITGSDELKDGIDVGVLRNLLETSPERVTSRIMCARRLKPGVLYNAFLVPAFRSGLVAAGLLQDSPEINLTTPAWNAGSGATLNLPYYYTWEFRTGERGDFEQMVKDLKPLELTGIGLREMDCQRPGYGLQGNPNHRPLHLQLEGALMSLDTLPLLSQWGRDRGDGPEPLQVDLASLLNRNGANLELREIEIPPVSSDFGLSGAKLTIESERIRIGFRTAVPCQCAVYYGDTPSYDRDMNDETDDERVSHSFTIAGLERGREYRLRIYAKSGGPWTSISEEIGFRFHDFPMVLPPLYGQWHGKKQKVSSSLDGGGWFHTLNLDPRHRAAAGIAAEVIRREQEDLMASAWEQAGDLDFANSILRQSRLGMEVSGNIYKRLSVLSDEDLLIHTRSLHRRTKVELESGSFTVAGHIRESRVPVAALDPAFRRIGRKYGSIKKRLKKTRFKKGPHILTRFNDGENPFRPAGEPPIPGGTQPLCLWLEKIKEGLERAIREKVGENGEERGLCFCCHCVERRKREVSDKENPVQETEYICCTCSQCEEARRNETQQEKPESKAPAPEGSAEEEKSEKEKREKARAYLRGLRTLFGETNNFRDTPLCDGGLAEIFARLRERILKGESAPPVLTPESTPEEKQRALVFALPGLLASDRPAPLRPPLDMAGLRTGLMEQIDPKRTIAARLRHRLGIASDQLFFMETIMAAPEFPQPMYASLRDISQEYICPGIETIKNNTVGLLSTNRRFIESFMVGLNHEFAAELFWREYPTDRRGTYFKQFWEAVRSPEVEEVARSYLLGAGLEETEESLEKTITEMLEDIGPIHKWRNRALGENPSELAHRLTASLPDDGDTCENEEKVVLVIRGNLLKKYPDTKIYIYKEEEHPGFKTIDQFFDGLNITLNQEETRSFSGNPPQIFEPFFRADIPPDISLIGFNLQVCDIKREKHYFCLEERTSRVRYGLDIENTPGSSANGSWNNLSWEHFGMLDQFGAYIDSISFQTDVPFNNLPTGANAEWNSHSANIASFTQQKPVRLVIDLNQMIPEAVLKG